MSFGYTGEQTDGNGLLYLRARYYAPSQGRFFQLDPSRLEVNLYQYSYSNPANYTEPSGLYPIGWREAEAQGRAALILKENRQDSVEALAQLFIDPRLDKRFVAPATGSSAAERLEFILRYVSDFPGIPLGPFAIKIDGSGLNPNLDDGTDDQINHFLTAVVLGYDSSFIDTRVAVPSTNPSVTEPPIPSSVVWV